MMDEEHDVKTLAYDEAAVVSDGQSELSDDTLFGVMTDDVVLYRKQALVQRAIDEIGFTPFHWKLFVLNGFGYAADSLLVVCESIAQPQVQLQFNRVNDRIPGVSTASCVGLFVGAVFWGMGADIIGRRLAFNTSLFISAIFVIIAGAMPNFLSFCAMVTIYSAGSGGNYILDATNFYEFLPRAKAHLTTILAVWWGVGYTITGLLAWAFMSNYSCLTVEDCPGSSNRGWRYLHFSSGALVLAAAILRLTIIKMPHTPKWLVTQNKDEEVVEFLQNLATKYNRPMTLTLDQLTSLGEVKSAPVRTGRLPSVSQFTKHVRGLFATRKLAYSTFMMIMLWVLIGLGDPLYSYFRPYYLKTRGYADSAPPSNYITWRNYAIQNICGLAGPLLAWPLINTPYIKRRGTLAIGAALTMAFLIGYTQVKTGTQNMALSFVTGAVENIFFGALYGVTPELLPTSSRATGYGIAVAINRICNVMAQIIAGYTGYQTAVVPLFVAAGMFGAMAIVSLLLPFEPAGKIIA